MTTSDLRKAAQAVFDAFCASGSIHIDIIRSLGAPMKELGAALAQPEPEPPTLADVLDALNVFNPMEGAEQWVESDDIAVKALPKFIHSVGKAWYLAPSAQPDPMTSERHFALREAHAIGAADAYFKANPDHDDEHARAMFERGFGRGFDSHERLIAQPAPKEFDADDMQEQWTAGFNAGRAQPEQQAPVTVNNAMVDAYLKANDAYWYKTDGLPQTPGKWRNGTPYEATRVSLIAALEAAHPPAQPQVATQSTNEIKQLGEETSPQPAAQAARWWPPEPVIIEVVGVVRHLDDDKGSVVRWSLEDGIHALEDGTVLMVSEHKLTGDDGSGEVYLDSPAPPAPPAQPQEPDDLYWRLHSLSKVLESSGRIDEHEQKGAYATILDAMNHVRSKP